MIGPQSKLPIASFGVDTAHADQAGGMDLEWYQLAGFITGVEGWAKEVKEKNFDIRMIAIKWCGIAIYHLVFLLVRGLR